MRQARVEKELAGTTEVTRCYYVIVSYERVFELTCWLSRRADRRFRISGGNMINMKQWIGNIAPETTDDEIREFVQTLSR